MMTDHEHRWERLVDGELPFAEQRELLATLDETPDGWKRLALALLEADAFRRELRDCLPAEPVVVAMPVHTASAMPAKHDPSKRAISRRMQALSACAIGLVCLGLGMRLDHLRRPDVAVADRSAVVAPTFAADEPQTRQTLKLVFADGPAGGHSVEVPVIDGEEIEAAGLLQQSAVSDELRQQLEAQGYVIHEERKFVPVTLANGRQGIAPISDVVLEYQPVAFQ